jgi:hypothetical protein
MLLALVVSKDNRAVFQLLIIFSAGFYLIGMFPFLRIQCMLS